ncbi:hypothetical protein IW140_000347 [Coemansia sp. RSA 1813]|nr:hypothetical protein EV178_000695 [Coemansia sp. RSA 1646]KAJ1773219.1 hypothetical protein LPJ74_000729 [Coemansia sp. RSA 1843]KAJ2092687.1 hypothetical protein IW138_000781 [Coemansia sp. RSA 986]KAJ2217816.1 hypothetical protein EV179_000302 [Coemansia sp. RSA 487]KAJ2572949.1 hypothetical protein IW140_000347 [Coemansia sp. RSA 1813]
MVDIDVLEPAAATNSTAMGDDTKAGATRTAEAQLNIYQMVPLYIDNLFSHTRVLPVHRVPSPTNTTGISERRPRLTHNDQLAAHLEGNTMSSLYTLRSQPDTCIQWRLLADRRTLELRPLHWVAGADASAQDLTEQQYLDAQALEEAGGESLACVTSSWCFETLVLSNIVISDHVGPDGRTNISITVCARNGVVYRLAFASVWEISSDSVDVNSCTSWYQIEWCHDAGSRTVSGRTPVIFDGLDERLLAVGCEDSALVWLQWQNIPDDVCGSLQGYVVERVTSSSNIIRSVAGFIPRLLRCGGGSNVSDEESAASRRLVSFSITQVLDGSVQYAVTLSRDRKLRFWSSSQSSQCQHEEQLPQLDVMGGVIPADPHDPSAASLLDCGVRRCIRIVSHGLGAWMNDSEMETGRNNVFGVLVFVPDEATPYFTLLQVSIDPNGHISNVQTVMYKVCKAANGASQLMADDELVDFQLSRHEELVSTLVEGPGGQAVEEDVPSVYWTLWALWERSQETILTHTYFSLHQGAPSADGCPQIQFDGHPVLGERWYSVLSQQRELRPVNDGPQIKEIEARLARVNAGQNSGSRRETASVQSEALDEQSDKRAVQVADISRAFLDHLFHPSRFDRGVLEHALGLYETSARDRGFDFPATPYQVTSSSPHLRQRIAMVVGSFLRAETSRRDGSLLVDEYHKALFTEWMRYSTLCARMQRIANTPRSLALCQSTDMVCVVSSNCVSVVQAAGEIEWMHALSRRDPAASILLSAPENAIARSYPDLAQGNARAEVARLLSAASYVTSAIAVDTLSALTDEMAQDASGEILVSLEARAAELFERHMADSFSTRHMRHATKLLGLCRAPGDTIRNLLQALTESTDIVGPVTLDGDPQSFKSSASMDGLFASAFAMSVSARFSLARDIVLLLICITYHEDEVEHIDIGALPPLLSHGFGVFSLFAILQWMSSQSISEASEEPSVVEDPAAVDGFLRKFSVLNIDKRRDSAGSIASRPGKEQQATVASTEKPKPGTSFIYSLLHSIIDRGYALRFVGRSGVFADMVTEGVSQIYAHFGFSAGWNGHPPLVRGTEAQPSFVLFAAKMEKSAPGEMTEAFLQFLPKTTAACYLSGLVSLRVRDYAAASDFFSNASIAYAQVFESVRTGVDLQYVLPQHVLESGHAFTYYEHIADLFETVRYFAGVSRFSHLALASLQDDVLDIELTGAMVREHQQKLWFKIFHAELEQNAFEQAYIATMSNPDQKVQQDCLRHLIGVLCERNGGVAVLCRLSFSGLQEDVERSLLFKARHSDILAKPNYYRILYSFHIYRGNYRNAASAMYQYARRLSTHMMYGGDVSKLLSEQAQALLACINGLSLVDKQYAWVVVGRQHGSSGGACDTPSPGLRTPGDSNTKRKRRRIAISRYGSSTSSQCQDIDIIELSDIRREYMLCTARITLGATFQELFSRNLLLEPEDLVALYVKTGMYDSAMTFAKEFGLKLDYVFRALVQKCLELSSVGGSAKTQHEHIPEAFWKNHAVQNVVGTSSERAWRLLQHYLDQEEPDETHDQNYRLLVADAVLGAETDAELAPWLTFLLLRRCPQDLVRLCLRNGCVTEGAEFLLQHINALSSKEGSSESISPSVAAKATRELWLPYKLVDQTMGVLGDAIAKFEDAVSKIKHAKKQASGSHNEIPRLRSLLKSYRERLTGLRRLHADLQNAFDRYMEYAARESRDISELCMS